MLKNSISLMAAAAFTFAGPALAHWSGPNLRGTYRCEPQPTPCKWQGRPPRFPNRTPSWTLRLIAMSLPRGNLRATSP
jgi:hypothetical protein